MYKVKRNPQKFEPFDLFSTLVEELGYSISEKNIVEKITKVFSKSIEDATKADTMIYGARNEGLFSYMVRGLGKVKFIKKEDSGDAFMSTSEKIIIPDFRIILEDGSLIFVEVKNFNKNPIDNKYKFKKEYIQSLERYCRLNKGELKVAIYYTGFNRWVLLSPERFVDKGNSFEIEITDAFMYSELSCLGDFYIATRFPLEVYLKADESKTKKILSNSNKEEYNFVTKHISFKSGNQNIDDNIGKKIAYNLALYGEWEEKIDYLKNDGKLIGIKFTYFPRREGDEIEDNEDVTIITQYSVLLTKFFRMKTSDEKNIKLLSYSGKPADVRNLIPKNYNNPNFPLLKLYLRSNSEE